jgi:hypothetical protein
MWSKPRIKGQMSEAAVFCGTNERSPALQDMRAKSQGVAGQMNEAAAELSLGNITDGKKLKS